MALTFNTFPTDDELAQLEPNYFSGPVMKQVERVQELRAVPGQYPLSAVAGCVAYPLVGFGVALYLFHIITNYSTAMGERLFFVGAVASAAVILLLSLINRRSRDSGEFFVLDKKARTLKLPRERNKVELKRDQIMALVLFEAPGNDCYIYDLAAIAENPDGGYSRYTVFRDQYTTAPDLAAKIAALLGIPLQRKKMKGWNDAEFAGIAKKDSCESAGGG